MEIPSSQNGQTKYSEKSKKASRKVLKDLPPLAANQRVLTAGEGKVALSKQQKSSNAENIKESAERKKSTKFLVFDDFPDRECETKKTASVECQTENRDESEEVIKMLTSVDPQPGYWKILAEQRQAALADALKENEDLWEKVDELERELQVLRVKSEEAEKIITMFKDMLGPEFDGDGHAEDSQTNNEDSCYESGVSLLE